MRIEGTRLAGTPAPKPSSKATTSSGKETRESQAAPTRPSTRPSTPPTTSARHLEGSSTRDSNPAASRELVQTQARTAASLTGPRLDETVAAASTQVVIGADDAGNPFDHNATGVEVTPYDGTGGSPNDTLESILVDQGFSTPEIYATNENGQTLIQQVAHENNIVDPDLIHSGDQLTVPTLADVSPVSGVGELVPQEQDNENRDLIQSIAEETIQDPQYGETGQVEEPVEIPEDPAGGEFHIDPAAELTELAANFDYLLDPENGDANVNDTASFDGGIADVANGDWNREGFVEEWSSSYLDLNPDLSAEEATAMAEARADRFQSGAERVLGDETLRNIVDAGGDSRNRFDGRFNLPDVLVAGELFSEEAGKAFNVLNDHRESLSYFGQPALDGVSIQSPTNGDQVQASHLEQLASLADNEQFVNFLENENFSLEDWANSDSPRGSEIVQSLLDGQSNVGPPLQADQLDDLVTAASFITDHELLSFQHFNSADGNRGSSALSFQDLANLAALQG